MAEVLVVGAGPVGLTLAAELARHGVTPRIVDRSMGPSPYCRAIGVTPRTLEVFEDMGVAGPRPRGAASIMIPQAGARYARYPACFQAVSLR